MSLPSSVGHGLHRRGGCAAVDYTGESFAYVQWTGERFAKYASHTHGDLDHTAIRGSHFGTADVFIDLTVHLVDYKVNNDDDIHDNHPYHSISHVYYYYFFFFVFFFSEFFLINHNYGDELVSDFDLAFEYDLKSDLDSDFKPHCGAVVVNRPCASPDHWYFCRCSWGHRRYPDSDSEKPFYENENSTGGVDPLASRGSHIFHISPPILRTSKYRPDFFNRPAPAPILPQANQQEPPVQSPNIDRNTIGLAISRPRSFVPPRPSPKIFSSFMSSPRPAEAPPLQRKPSKLLPPRPALTLDIPPTTVPTGAPSSQVPPTTDRTSTFTNLTGFADLDSEAAEGGQTWRPPPTDPQSATTLYVADKYGNWVLSNNNRRSQIAQIVEAAELDTHTPLTKSPIEKQEEAARMADAISAATPMPRAPQPAFLSRDPANWTYSQSSSAYSQASAARQAGRRNSQGRNSALRSRKNSLGPSINRSDSKASATTIQTSSTGGNEEGGNYESDIARLSQLSPVQESPDPASKRPRVNNPKFSGRLDGATIRYVPPPKRPDFTGSPYGQPSPTLGVVYPVEGSPSAIPLPLNPRRKERRFVPIQREGSGFTPEPPNVEVFPIQNYARPNAVPNPGPYLRADFTPGQPAEPYRYGDNFQQRDPFLTPPQASVPTFTPSPPSPSPPEPVEKRSVSPPQPSIMDRGRPHIASQRAESGASFGTISSNGSSLLAKRLGNDKAGALVIDPYGKRPQQWRQQGDGTNNNGAFLSPDAYSLASPRGTLPQTPIWQPKLTPTRRGDDLFLNVQ
ncbi:hypothetical protein NPX13_g6760 [Xylaria arbuscula]|uniref:Uncharacterized protein n=1 Tax=Xylaria arbuscula TaxID=114810 RepID=A0A9W8NBL5_9PEZI|nr:hypothetical protein NPX13_g6760 [Xylaria arbuscula]